MRILSQTGMIDLPYESIGISINHNDSTKIVAYPAGNYNKEFGSWKIAEYSTAEKAQKAMEMLRKAYTGLPIIMQNVDITDDVSEMLKEWKKQGIVYRTENDEPSKIEVVNNGYFRFPADSEIEAQQ